MIYIFKYGNKCDEISINQPSIVGDVFCLKTFLVASDYCCMLKRWAAMVCYVLLSWGDFKTVPLPPCVGICRIGATANRINKQLQKTVSPDGGDHVAE